MGWRGLAGRWPFGRSNRVRCPDIPETPRPSLTDQRAAVIIAEDVEPLKPGEVSEIGFFADASWVAKELALQFLGGCVRQNLGRANVTDNGTKRSGR
jgi:hypothetical protein